MYLMQKMRSARAYTVDLTKTAGTGEVMCPKCGNLLSPDDDTDKAYIILEAVTKKGPSAGVGPAMQQVPKRNSPDGVQFLSASVSKRGRLARVCHFPLLLFCRLWFSGKWLSG